MLCYDTSSLSFEADVMKRIAGTNVSCILLTLITMQLTTGAKLQDLVLSDQSSWVKASFCIFSVS